jgi:hypothetical protein
MRKSIANFLGVLVGFCVVGFLISMIGSGLVGREPINKYSLVFFIAGLVIFKVAQFFDKESK